MSASPDPAADPELERLLDEYAARVRAYALERGTVRDGLSTRAAILAHVAAQYVRRDDPRYRILDRANERMIGYKAARGILPWKPGDELPEERIRRLRDDDRQHTLHPDGAGVVAGGAPDFEGDDGD